MRKLKIAVVGGGPAGLYFSLLMMKQDPGHEITVYERNRPGDTFGWGVVFSDETLSRFAENDAESHREITGRFASWSDIEILYRGARVRSTGHGFSGLARRALLDILQRRCAALGVNFVFEREIADADEFSTMDLVLAADGANSRLRESRKDAFGASVAGSRCKFSWLGTDKRLTAFTFIFKESAHGLFQVHAYPFDERTSTFIVECREEVWRRASLHEASEEQTVAHLEDLFREELAGHRLLTNRSLWRTFPTVKNRTWRSGNVLLMGDAAHTAHFSIGSGTKLAMEDAITLADAFKARPGAAVSEVLEAYEAVRLPEVARVQAAAATSLLWFENTPRYQEMAPLEFAFGLLTRSKRITYGNLGRRDPVLVAEVTEDFARSRVEAGAVRRTSEGRAAAPAFQPYRLGPLLLGNRIVAAPMGQDRAEEGMPGAWHRAHYGRLAKGGAGLVLTEAAAVAADARVTRGCAGLYEDLHAQGWRSIVEAVHQETDAAIGVQLSHAGRRGEIGGPLLAPSALPFSAEAATPRPMDESEMLRVTALFAGAAARAADAGFDVLELHMAHGYLLGSFLSPLTNQRDDAYGGSVEKRLRFPLLVMASVREAWPAERPLLVRISATDWHPLGTTSEDRLAIARALHAAGCDAIDVSGGRTVSDDQPDGGRMHLVPFSEEIRLLAGVPTIAVGHIESIDQCHTIVGAGRADLCALGRAHLADPFLTSRAEQAAGLAERLPPEAFEPRPGA